LFSLSLFVQNIDHGVQVLKCEIKWGPVTSLYQDLC